MHLAVSSKNSSAVEAVIKLVLPRALRPDVVNTADATSRKAEQEKTRTLVDSSQYRRLLDGLLHAMFAAWEYTNTKLLDGLRPAVFAGSDQCKGFDAM